MKISSSVIWSFVALVLSVAIAIYVIFFTEVDWWLRVAAPIANVILAALRLEAVIRKK